MFSSNRTELIIIFMSDCYVVIRKLKILKDWNQNSSRKLAMRNVSSFIDVTGFKQYN